MSGVAATRSHIVSIGILALLASLSSGAAWGQTGPQRPLLVATRHAPPFAIRGPDGSWSGLSVELWREVATELGFDCEWREMGLDEMVRGLEQGNVDVAVAALTATAQREKTMDFSHPFHGSGLGMAVQAEPGRDWGSLARQFFSPQLLQVFGLIAGLLLASGVAVYFLERRTNPDHFGKGILRGLGDGVWWAAVTMTTVGYGDKVPRSFGGRLLALVWMLAGILLIAGFTAAATATLTAEQLQPRLSGPDDLPRARIACVAGSTGQEYLRGQHLAGKAFGEADQALTVLRRGECDVVVYDAPILRYAARQQGGAVVVLPRTFQRQDYALGFPEGSPLREPCNRILLRVITSPGWQARLERYLGSP